MMSTVNSVVLDYHNSLLRQSDVNLLRGAHWLNDTVIGFYFEYLEQKLRSAEDTRNVLLLSPEVTQLIKLSSGDMLPLVLEPLEVASYSYCFMAVNDAIDPEEAGGSHWSLLIWVKAKKTFLHLDSCPGSNKTNAKQIAVKLAKYLSLPNINVVELNCSRQNNNYDCGIHVVANAEAALQAINSNEDVETLENPKRFPNVSLKRQEILELVTELAKETHN